MDAVIQLAAIIALGGAAGALPADARERHASSVPAAAAAAWPGEDKFRHIAMSWTTTTFSYAAARAAGQDGDTALAIALPIAAAIGVGKEIADQRRSGGFSVRDLAADALGAGAAWFLLREVR